MTDRNPNRAPETPEDEPLDGLFTEKKSVAPRDRTRLGKSAAAVVVLGVLAYFVWQWINEPSGVQRKPAEMAAIIPLPPPPPPPPEPEPPP